MLGAASAGFTAGMLYHGHQGTVGFAVALGVLVALAYLAGLKTTYYLTILRATSETKLRNVGS
jgi:hypothetical protein